MNPEVGRNPAMQISTAVLFKCLCLAAFGISLCGRIAAHEGSLENGLQQLAGGRAASTPLNRYQELYEDEKRCSGTAALALTDELARGLKEEDLSLRIEVARLLAGVRSRSAAVAHLKSALDLESKEWKRIHKELDTLTDELKRAEKKLKRDKKARTGTLKSVTSIISQAAELAKQTEARQPYVQSLIQALSHLPDPRSAESILGFLPYVSLAATPFVAEYENALLRLGSQDCLAGFISRFKGYTEAMRNAHKFEGGAEFLDAWRMQAQASLQTYASSYEPNDAPTSPKNPYGEWRRWLRKHKNDLPELVPIRNAWESSVSENPQDSEWKK